MNIYAFNNMEITSGDLLRPEPTKANKRVSERVSERRKDREKCPGNVFNGGVRDLFNCFLFRK